jgi:hypothetical protein
MDLDARRRIGSRTTSGSRDRALLAQRCRVGAPPACRQMFTSFKATCPRAERAAKLHAGILSSRATDRSDPSTAETGITEANTTPMNTPFDRISIDPEQMNGQPCIRGLRLTVRRVVEAAAMYPDRAELKREHPSRCSSGASQHRCSCWVVCRGFEPALRCRRSLLGTIAPWPSPRLAPHLVHRYPARAIGRPRGATLVRLAAPLPHIIPLARSPWRPR